MARPSFFKEMLLADSFLKSGSFEVDGQLIPYSQGTKLLFRRLVSFVEACSFSKAKSAQFLCSNWRLDVDSLQHMWEKKVQGDGTKTKSAWRGQISETSKALYGFFPMFSSDVFFREEVETLQQIDSVLNALEISASCPEDVFISEVCDYIDYQSYTSTFDISECGKELEFLSFLTRSRVFAKLDELDIEKLSFILRTLVGKMVNLRGRTIDMNKIEIYKQLSLIHEDSDFLNQSTSSLSASDGQVGNGVSEMKDGYVVSETSLRYRPYKLEMTDALFDILQARISEQLTESKQSKVPEKEYNEWVQKIQVAFDRWYNLEGFAELIGGAPLDALVSAVDKYKN